LKVIVDIWKSYANDRLGADFLIPPDTTADQIPDAQGLSVYIHEVGEELPGTGVTITKSSQNLSNVLNQVGATLRTAAQSQQSFNGQSWTIYTFVDDRSGQQFIDAFSEHSGTLYQVSGQMNPFVVEIIPKLLSTFAFL